MVFRLRVFGPLFFAVMLTWMLEGKNGIKKLFRSFLVWRINPKWFLFALSWKFLYTYIGIAVLVLFGLVTWPGFLVPNIIGGTWDALFQLIKNLPFIVGIAIVEETAWMKFGVTRLQDKNNALRSSVLIGLAWGLWYLPMLLIGEGVPDGIPWPFFMLSMISLTILLSWLYNMTHSGLVLLIAQMVSNSAFFIIPILPGWHDLDPSYVIAFVGAHTFFSILIILIYGYKHLCKGERAKWSNAV